MEEMPSSNTARWLYPNALDALSAMAPWSELRIDYPRGERCEDVPFHGENGGVFLDGMMLLDFLFHFSFRW